MNKGRILFLMALRNRRERALMSIQSIASSRFANHFECLIVQDVAEDNITREDVAEISIPVTIVNQHIGGIFYKTKLLNIGFVLTQNKYIVQQDADVLYTEPFLEKIIKICSNPENFKKYFFTAPYTESDDMQEPAVNVWKDDIRKKGDFVGDTFLLYRPQVEAVNGFDEQMRMWHEEEDFGNRIMTHFKLAQYDLGVVGISNIHMTHNNNLRSHTREEALKNLNIFNEHRKNSVTTLYQQHMGGMVMSAHNGIRCVHRNSEGDLTAARENLQHDIYTIHELNITDSVVLDIGSHVGTFALGAAKKAKKVVCYEPDMASAMLCVKNADLNNIQNIEVRSKAMTVDGRDVMLHIHPELSVLNSIVHNPYGQLSEKIPSDAFNDVVQTIKPQLIKIDCEGGEYEMLYGATAAVLTGVTYICLEYHDMSETNAAYNGKDLLAHMDTIGFEVIMHKPDYDQKGRTGIAVLKNRV